MTRREARKILKSYAKEHGLQALADKIGCGKPFASLLVNGKRGVGLDNALNIEAHFQIPAKIWTDARKRSAA